MLKWMSQLLLNRGAHHLTPLTQFQWAWKGKQAEELLMLMRKLTRTAEDWGIQFWIVKLDIRSIRQCAAAVSGGHGGVLGGGTRENALGSARVAQPAPGTAHSGGGGGGAGGCQANHGSKTRAPDSPLLFSALIGRILQLCLPPLPPKGEAHQRAPECPTTGGAFMDDTYLWDTDPDRLQAVRRERGVRPNRRGHSHARNSAGSAAAAAPTTPSRPDPPGDATTTTEAKAAAEATTTKAAATTLTTAAASEQRRCAATSEHPTTAAPATTTTTRIPSSNRGGQAAAAGARRSIPEHGGQAGRQRWQ
ncbi:unnamed protein product [Symbiodinium natans]|uniref:Uncharacterized protein n=1 Tax=Symbiodinium natans TaxID=878477 RepID=A0A812RVJ9_9DINO|nr:unnamed protein product [Symbiodinium natans]